MLCGRNAVQIHDHAGPLNLAELGRKLAPLGQVRANEFALRFLLSPYEMTIFPDGRAINCVGLHIRDGDRFELG